MDLLKKSFTYAILMPDTYASSLSAGLLIKGNQWGHPLYKRYMMGFPQFPGHIQ